MRGFLSGAIAGLAVSAVGVAGLTYVTGPVSVPAPDDVATMVEPDAETPPEQVDAADETPVEETPAPEVEAEPAPADNGPEQATPEPEPEAEAPAPEPESAPVPVNEPEADDTVETVAEAPVEEDDAADELPVEQEAAVEPDVEPVVEPGETTNDTAQADPAPEAVAEVDEATAVAEEEQPAPEIGPEATEPEVEPAPESVPDPEVTPSPAPDLVEPDESPAIPAPETAPESSGAPVVASPEADAAPDVATEGLPDPEIGLEAGTPLPEPPAVAPPVEAPSSEETVATIPDLPLPDQPGAGTPPDVDSAAPEEVPQTALVPDTEQAPEPEALPDALPEAVADGPVSIPDTEGPSLPAPDVAIITPGVENDRLPTIGGDTAEAEEAASEEEAAESEQADADVTAADAPALKAFATEFELPAGQPVLSILLFDTGSQRVAPGDLEGLPFPLTIVVDPGRADAAERARAFRAAGHEVVVLTEIPADMEGEAVASAFDTVFNAVPEAVAVLDVPDALLQENRPRAEQVTEILAETGHGLITYSRGLNSGVQVAQSAGVPAAVVFRDVDDGTRQGSVIRRLLDVGAFRASQERAVIVTGELRPVMITALTEWTLSIRAATVTLAPVSALLQSQ